MPLLGGIAGGQSLGHAQGRISIDTSGLNQATVAVQRVSAQVERGFGSIGGAARTAQRTIGELRSELLAVGAVGGLATAFGLGAARDLRNYTVAFRTLLGTQEQAEEVMHTLTNTANEFGLELEGVLQLGRALMPILEGNTDELDEWVKRAALLRSIFPAAQRGAETRAIAEFLAGQTMSLQRLFNIPPAMILEAQAAFSDYGSQLDFILARMGATEEGAREMADSFQGLKNELKLTAAVGFTPLFNSMQSNVREFREWLEMVRETSPETLELGANLLGIVAVGAPLLLFINQLVTALQRLKIASIAVGATRLFSGTMGGAAGAIGGAAGAASVGALLGLGLSVPIVRGLGRTGIFGEQDVSDFGLMDAAEALLSVPDVIREQLARIAPQTFAHAPSPVTQADIEAAQRIQAGGSLFGPIGGAGTVEAGIGGPLPVDLIQEWAQSIEDIERDANEQRLSQTQNYEQQRSETIANYERTIAREAEDFARQRARQEAQLAADIADIRADAIEREAEWQAEYVENIADIRADANERIAELEEDYARQRERAQRDHRDNLLSAAARLDAAAVAEEQRRFARQGQDAEESYRDRLETEQENLQERIEQEQESHEKRLRQFREADEERIRDLQEAVVEQRRIEDEDRAIRLQRLAEDHQNELIEMDVQHQQRLDQIARQAQQEREQLDQAFQEQLAQEDLATQAFLTQQKLRQNAALRLFNEWWDEINGVIREATAGLATGGAMDRGGGTTMERFARGGLVERTGLAFVHAGEYVMTPAMMQTSRSVNINAPIQIWASGQLPGEIGLAVRNELAGLLREFA